MTSQHTRPPTGPRPITAEDACAFLVRTPGARRHLSSWTTDPTRSQVVPRVMAHSCIRCLTTPLSEVVRTCRKTEHALGEIQKEDVKGIVEARDWTTAFAATHVWHFIIEAEGGIPTWGEFKTVLMSRAYAPMLWDPVQREIEQLARHRRLPQQLVADAFQWRLGNFYYSFLREQYVHAVLRVHGIHFAQHPLADALFAVDGWHWHRHTVFNLYVGNPRYRKEERGRKVTSQARLRGADPGFTMLDLPLEPATKFGSVHLPEEQEIIAAAGKFRG